MYINLKGVFLCMKYELRQMLKQGGGMIVNTASAYGLVGAGNREMGLSAYVASKHGVVGQTKATALEYGEANIRVNAVAPGAVGISPQVLAVKDEIEKRIPLGRLGTALDVASLAAFLLSDEAGYITGQVLNVDGGMLT